MILVDVECKALIILLHILKLAIEIRKGTPHVGLGIRGEGANE